jgi:hypothetical protein
LFRGDAVYPLVNFSSNLFFLQVLDSGIRKARRFGRAFLSSSFSLFFYCSNSDHNHRPISPFFFPFGMCGLEDFFGPGGLTAVVVEKDWLVRVPEDPMAFWGQICAFNAELSADLRHKWGS